MKSGTHAERIVKLLRETSGLDDDEIARALGIEPRQTVNQVCRQLAADGALLRKRGATGKICNFALHDAIRSVSAEPAFPDQPKHSTASLTGALLPSNLRKMLLIIPCSGAKRHAVGKSTSGESLLQDLSPELLSEFLDARTLVKQRIQHDDSTLAPAWQRYDGALYQAGREGINAFLQAGAHVIILSGGYGAVLATELIGTYEAVLNPSWWPRSIIERVLLAYIERHQLTSVRAVISATGPYITIIRRVKWKNAGVYDSLLMSPHAERGAMRKSPATQGEAITALYNGALQPDWRSSYGLGINFEAAD